MSDGVGGGLPDRRGRSRVAPVTVLRLPMLDEPPGPTKPPWLKVRAPQGERYVSLKRTLRTLQLNTVCEHARCPNVGECWGRGTATVMLLGEICTRGCRFCAVTSGHPGGAVDGREPEHTAEAVAQLGLQYVVLTMVDRDDLPDGGAAHVARTVALLHERQPGLLVEALTGDFGGREEPLGIVLDAAPDVFAHNLEVTRAMTPRVRDRRCSYDRSLALLGRAREHLQGGLVKSSLMVGIGETDEEIYEALADLRRVGVDVVTLGQYLRPTPRHAPVARYVTPEQFVRLRRFGEELGFAHVVSGPLVRSSYEAAEAYAQGVLGAQRSSAGVNER